MRYAMFKHVLLTIFTVLLLITVGRSYAVGNVDAFYTTSGVMLMPHSADAVVTLGNAENADAITIYANPADACGGASHGIVLPDCGVTAPMPSTLVNPVSNGTYDLADSGGSAGDIVSMAAQTIETKHTI